MADEKMVNVRMDGGMHTKLQLAAATRGTSMQSILSDGLSRELDGDPQDMAKQFVRLAGGMMRGRDPSNVLPMMTGKAAAVTKAAVNAMDWSQAWSGGDGKSLADSFLATLAPTSVLDAVAPFAQPVPPGTKNCQIVSGASADLHSEGEPILSTSISLTGDAMTRQKIAAIIALSDVLLRTGDETYQLIRNELTKQVSRVSNTAFLSALTVTNATAGATAVDSLQAGLDALPDCGHIVVAANYSTVRELALNSDGRMAIGGGQYLPGVSVVPVSGLTNMHVIAADRIVLDAGTMELLPSSEANVLMDDNPQAAINAADPNATPPVLRPQQTSLFQQNMVAVRAVRQFAVSGSAVKVA